MADEARTETAVPDAVNAGAGLFGDEEPMAQAEGAAEERATDESEDVEQKTQDGDHAEGRPADAPAEDTAAEELKVVVSVRGDRALVGVQRTGADPHIEAFEERDLPALTQEVTAVVERARAKWEESPKHPVHTRPAPAKSAPTKRRQRSGQAQDEAEASQGGTVEQQPEALRLF